MKAHWYGLKISIKEDHDKDAMFFAKSKHNLKLNNKIQTCGKTYVFLNASFSTYRKL